MAMPVFFKWFMLSFRNGGAVYVEGAEAQRAMRDGAFRLTKTNLSPTEMKEYMKMGTFFFVPHPTVKK